MQEAYCNRLVDCFKGVVLGGGAPAVMHKSVPTPCSCPLRCENLTKRFIINLRSDLPTLERVFGDAIQRWTARSDVICWTYVSKQEGGCVQVCVCAHFGRFDRERVHHVSLNPT